MKLRYLLIVMMLLTTNKLFTQETKTLTNDSLTMYMDISSGVINKNEDNLPLLNGNETEFGLDYSTSFTTAQWLRMGFKGYVLLHLDVDSTPTNVVGIGSQGVYIKDPSASVYFKFLDYVTVEVDTLLRFKPSVHYTLNLPVSQWIRFYAGVEIYTIARPTATSTFLKVPQHLGLLDLRLIYNINFHKSWAFRSELRFRFDGSGGANGIGGFVKPDSSEALLNSFNIRWNNSIVFNLDNYSVYAQLRYQPERLSHNIFDPIHKLSVHAGLSYTFDLN